MLPMRKERGKKKAQSEAGPCRAPAPPSFFEKGGEEKKKKDPSSEVRGAELLGGLLSLFGGWEFEPKRKGGKKGGKKKSIS